MGIAPVVILTGGNPVDPSVPEATVMALVAEEVGSKPGVLVVERTAARTFTQGEAVARIARERGIRSILLVTSAEHSYRSVRVFRKTGLDVISTPVVAAAPAAAVDRAGASGTSSRACARSQGVAYESVALALYWWRGWL